MRLLTYDPTMWEPFSGLNVRRGLSLRQAAQAHQERSEALMQPGLPPRAKVQAQRHAVLALSLMAMMRVYPS